MTFDNRHDTNNNKDKQFTTEVRLKDEPLEIVDEVKLLGVIINKDLKWSKNTNYLVKKANKKMRMLHIASKFTRNREHLKLCYCYEICKELSEK